MATLTGLIGLRFSNTSTAAQGFVRAGAALSGGGAGAMAAKTAAGGAAGTAAKFIPRGAAAGAGLAFLPQ